MEANDCYSEVDPGELVGWIGASHVISLHHVGQQELLQDVKG